MENDITCTTLKIMIDWLIDWSIDWFRQHPTASRFDFQHVVSYCSTVTTTINCAGLSEEHGSDATDRQQTDRQTDWWIAATSLCSASSTRLSTWHCPHLLLNAVLRRRCCWAPVLAAVDRHLLPAGRSAANLPHAAVGSWHGKTDGQTDGRSTVS